MARRASTSWTEPCRSRTGAGPGTVSALPRVSAGAVWWHGPRCSSDRPAPRTAAPRRQGRWSPPVTIPVSRRCTVSGPSGRRFPVVMIASFASADGNATVADQSDSADTATCRSHELPADPARGAAPVETHRGPHTRHAAQTWSSLGTVHTLPSRVDPAGTGVQGAGLSKSQPGLSGANLPRVGEHDPAGMVSSCLGRRHGRAGPLWVGISEWSKGAKSPSRATPSSHGFG